MDYDPTFDQMRLDQLAAQCLTGSTAQGQVVFLSDSEDNRLDVSTWLVDEEDRAGFKASGFQGYLLELLDTLLVYRWQHRQPNASQGVVYIEQGTLRLEWLSRDEAEKQRGR